MVEALNGTPVASLATGREGAGPSPSMPPVGDNGGTQVAIAAQAQDQAYVGEIAATQDGTNSLQADSNATATGKNGAYTEEELQKLTDEMNEKLYALNSEVQFRVDKRINRPYISVVDKKTNEVVREFPPEASRDLINRLREYDALLKSGQHPKKHLLVNIKV